MEVTNNHHLRVSKRLATIVRTIASSFMSIVIGTAVLATVPGCTTSSSKVAEQQPTPEQQQKEMVLRGKYLVNTSACHDCHTPKVMTPMGPALDTARLLSGHPSGEPLAGIPAQQDWILFSPGLTAAVGPWGISFSANLTPDKATGTGNWTYEQFETAIRKGKSKGLERARDLLPPMPWQMYQLMKDEDLRAIFAYLQSIKPVNNAVPAPIPPQSSMGDGLATN